MENTDLLRGLKDRGVTKNIAGAMGATVQRLQARSLHALMGILNGICCDGEINSTEVAFLSTWLREHDEARATWPGSVVHRLVSEVLADGVITQIERDHLQKQLSALVSTDFVNTGTVMPEPLLALVDDDPHVIHAGREFVFTGDFLFGTRAHCERAGRARGAEVADRVTKRTSYLVIGSMGSPLWLEGNFGTKIRQAAKMAESGEHEIAMIREADWVMTL